MSSEETLSAASTTSPPLISASSPEVFEKRFFAEHPPGGLFKTRGCHLHSAASASSAPAPSACCSPPLIHAVASARARQFSTIPFDIVPPPSSPLCCFTLWASGRQIPSWAVAVADCCTLNSQRASALQSSSVASPSHAARSDSVAEVGSFAKHFLENSGVEEVAVVVPAPAPTSAFTCSPVLVLVVVEEEVLSPSPPAALAACAAFFSSTLRAKAFQPHLGASVTAAELDEVDAPPAAAEDRSSSTSSPSRFIAAVPFSHIFRVESARQSCISSLLVGSVARHTPPVFHVHVSCSVTQASLISFSDPQISPNSALFAAQKPPSWSCVVLASAAFAALAFHLHILVEVSQLP
mmetsp:Transcript_2410/g.5621  ORF Transcript_2410/g.5621 Transcript_2410/m.5621 type:complete len:352 (+) Transcript_2410:3086-4141(+)